jgi:membrane protease YdiL (CAAX protease family)
MSKMRAVFMGEHQLRAGWRLIIFLAFVLPLGYGAGKIVDSLNAKLHAATGTPWDIGMVMGIFACAIFAATGIMAKIEGRSFADYGLPWRRAFCRQFWQGAAISFASLSILLLVIHLAGGFSFDALGLHGAEILKFGILWAFAGFVGALLEDFTYRGYLLFTLTTGLGFWPAAILTSLLMGGMHYLNPGGHGLGPVAAFLYCMATCVVIRRTGDLWMALGIHSAWNWGEIFFYGIPDSGFPSQGHLLVTRLHGPTWLTGGPFGAEAGWPSIALLIIWIIFFSLWLRGVRYPNQAALEKRSPMWTAGFKLGRSDI